MSVERSNRALLWSLVLVAFTCDIASKYAAFRTLQDDCRAQSEFVLVPGVFKLLTQYSDQPAASEGTIGLLRSLGGQYLPHVNHGALFSLGDHHRLAANAFFASVSTLAALAICWWSFRSEAAGDRTLCIALGLILGGTLGNLYDRIVFNGVRDFLYFHWIEFPVFNVADCCLVCGACLLLLQALCQRQPQTPAIQTKCV